MPDPLDALFSDTAKRDPLDALFTAPAQVSQPTHVNAVGVPGVVQQPYGGGNPPSQENPGILTDIQHGIAQGPQDLYRQFGNAGAAAAQFIGPENLSAIGLQPGSFEDTSGYQPATNAGIPEPVTLPGRLARGVVPVAGMTALGLAGAGPAAFAGIGAAQGAGGAYEAARGRGMPEDVAAAEALPAGIAGAALNFIPGQRILAGAGGVRGALGTAAIGGAGAAGQEYTNMLLQRIAEDDPQAFNNALSRLGEAVLSGAVLTGGAHAVTAMGSRFQDNASPRLSRDSKSSGATLDQRYSPPSSVETPQSKDVQLSPVPDPLQTDALARDTQRLPSEHSSLPAVEVPSVPLDFSSMPLKALKSEASRRGLETVGGRKALIERLSAKPDGPDLAQDNLAKLSQDTSRTDTLTDRQSEPESIAPSPQQTSPLESLQSPSNLSYLPIKDLRGPLSAPKKGTAKSPQPAYAVQIAKQLEDRGYSVRTKAAASGSEYLTIEYPHGTYRVRISDHANTTKNPDNPHIGNDPDFNLVVRPGGSVKGWGEFASSWEPVSSDDWRKVYGKDFNPNDLSAHDRRAYEASVRNDAERGVDPTGSKSVLATRLAQADSASRTGIASQSQGNPVSPATGGSPESIVRNETPSENLRVPIAAREVESVPSPDSTAASDGGSTIQYEAGDAHNPGIRVEFRINGDSAEVLSVIPPRGNRGHKPGMRELRRVAHDIQTKYPQIKSFGGSRVTGANGAREMAATLEKWAASRQPNSTAPVDGKQSSFPPPKSTGAVLTKDGRVYRDLDEIKSAFPKATVTNDQDGAIVVRSRGTPTRKLEALENWGYMERPKGVVRESNPALPEHPWEALARRVVSKEISRTKAQSEAKAAGYGPEFNLAYQSLRDTGKIDAAAIKSDLASRPDWAEQARRSREKESQVDQARKDTLAAISSRPGWTVDHLSDSGSIYAKHKATGKIIRISDHYVPDHDNDGRSARAPWETEIVSRSSSLRRSQFEDAASTIDGAPPRDFEPQPVGGQASTPTTPSKATIDPAKMTVAQLRAEIEATGVEVGKNSKAQLADAVRKIRQTGSLESFVAGHVATHTVRAFDDFSNNIATLKNVAGIVRENLGERGARIYNRALVYELPKMLSSSSETTNAAVQHASASIAAAPMTTSFMSRVLGPRFRDPKFVSDVGAVLTEDNLRDVAKSRAADPEDTGGPVHTTVGEKGYFKTEAEYQATKSDPAVANAIERHRAIVQPWMDAQHKIQQGIAPATDLPTRGLETGARINLLPLKVDPETGIKARINPPVPSGPRPPRLTSLLKRKSPFAQRATGTAEAYDVDYGNIIENTVQRQLSNATRMRFYDALVKSKDAVLTKTGVPAPQINGDETFAIDVKRGKGQDPQVLWVRKPLESEVRGVLGTRDLQNSIVGNSARMFVASMVNKLQVAGLADASYHTANVLSAIAASPGGRNLAEVWARKVPGYNLADAIGRTISEARAVKMDDPAVIDRLSFLAENGMLRAKHDAGPVGSFIQALDQSARLALDGLYTHMVNSGMAVDTIQDRRRFVNQAGQYNPRLRGPIENIAKSLGASPFIVAGRTFNKLGIRQVTGGSAVKSPTTGKAASVRAMQIAGSIGAGYIVVPALLNLATVGKVTGRPGVPIGAVDTGEDDKDGRPIYVDLAKWTGLRRGLKLTGANALIEGSRAGLKPSQIADSAVRDMVNSAIHPWAGPPVEAASVAMTGRGLGYDLPDLTGPVAPGDSVAAARAKAAVLGVSPLVEAADKEQSDSFWGGLLKQLGGAFGVRAGRATNPEAVEGSRMKDFVDASIREARRGGGDYQARMAKFNARMNTAKDLTPAELRRAMIQAKSRLKFD